MWGARSEELRYDTWGLGLLFFFKILAKIDILFLFLPIAFEHKCTASEKIHLGVSHAGVCSKCYYGLLSLLTLAPLERSLRWHFCEVSEGCVTGVWSFKTLEGWKNEMSCCPPFYITITNPPWGCKGASVSNWMSPMCLYRTAPPVCAWVPDEAWTGHPCELNIVLAFSRGNKESSYSTVQCVDQTWPTL